MFQPETYTSDKLSELGELVTGLAPEDLSQMPTYAVTSALGDLKDKEFDVSQCRAIINKVLQNW